MLFDYIAHDYSVQIFIVIGLVGCYVATLINRRVTKFQDAEREDKRASRAVTIRTGDN